MDQFNPVAREMMVFIASLQLEEVELVKKREGADAFNAIAFFYEGKEANWGHKHGLRLYTGREARRERRSITLDRVRDCSRT